MSQDSSKQGIEHAEKSLKRLSPMKAMHASKMHPTKDCRLALPTGHGNPKWRSGSALRKPQAMAVPEFETPQSSWLGRLPPFRRTKSVGPEPPSNATFRG